jgi:TonB family protein
VLRSRDVPTPIELAGTGLAPTVALQVHLDETGKVAAVTVESIRPSSEHDALIEKAVREAVLQWRFAPALEAGVPVGTVLQWSVDLPPVEESLTGVHWTGFGYLPAPVEFELGELMRVYTLPLEQQRRYLETIAGHAEALLDPARRREARSSNFVVVTDHPSESAAQTVLQNLEAASWHVYEMLKGKIEPQAVQGPVRAYFFSSRPQYQALVDKVKGLPESAGFYAPPGLIAFHGEMPSNDDLIDVMIHEASHAFVDRHVIRPGVVPPRWLSEGLAEYYGSSRVKKGKLVLGTYRRSSIYRVPWDVFLGRSWTQMNITEVKRRIRRGEALQLEELLGADRATFYSEKIHLFYTQSWMLVHFLIHGEEGWAEEEFPRFLLYVAEGFRPDLALRQTYGVGPEELEARYRRYCEKF